MEIRKINFHLNRWKNENSGGPPLVERLARGLSAGPRALFVPARQGGAVHGKAEEWGRDNQDEKPTTVRQKYNRQKYNGPNRKLLTPEPEQTTGGSGCGGAQRSGGWARLCRTGCRRSIEDSVSTACQPPAGRQGDRIRLENKGLFRSLDHRKLCCERLDKIVNKILCKPTEVQHPR